MPVKDYHGRFLDDAVASVLGQGSPDWRLLVIGERATRPELEAQLAGALADPRVDLIDNRGRKLAGAFNTGMREARTAFVAILLGDDLWESDAVELLSPRIAAAPEVDFWHSARRIVDEAGRPISSIHPSRSGVTAQDFVNVSSPVKHLLCWRRELGLAIGGMDESLNSVGVDDLDFPWCMAEAGARFGAVPECLYVYRDHRECFRLTTHLPLSHHRREIARILAKHEVDAESANRSLAHAQDTYLRQCLYQSPADRWLKRLRRVDPRRGWREAYR
jgi:GT2 family glycosyltransferase